MDAIAAGVRWRRVVASVLLLGLGPSGSVARADTTLVFIDHGKEVARRDLDALRATLEPETVTVSEDPYYGREKSFRAFPLHAVLGLGFGDRKPAAGESFFFRARDGYVKPAPAARVAESGAYLAFADAAYIGKDPSWEPIDRRRLDPGPYYLVWTGAGQNDAHRYPWPYQLVAIEIGVFADEYPHTVPTSAPSGGPAWRGFEIFRGECIACHAMNGQGGTIGPELNVPQSIVEYRPAAQIKAYIKNPATFRYTSMPAHPHLSEDDLDAMLAYFEVMKTLKHDPAAAR